MKKADNKAECSVSQQLALVLRVSRVAGIAPLRLEKKPDDWIVRVSPTMSVYGYLFVTSMNICTIIAIAFDLSVPIERSVRMHSRTVSLVWIADVIIVSVISSVGVYGASAKMKWIVSYINRIRKIKAELNMYTEPYSDNKQYGLVVSVLLVSIVMFIIDFALIIISIVEEERSMVVGIMYLSYYFSYLIKQLLELQFILVVFFVLSAFKQINGGLKAFIQEYGYREVNLKPSKIIDNRVNVYSTVRMKSINKTIDCLAIGDENKTDRIPSLSSRTSQQTIRRLALSYWSVCDVVRHVNKTNGVILVLLLASFLLHLIITPYYLIMFLLHDPATGLWEKYLHPILQLIWCVFHMIDLIMIIEPCHRTHEEMDLTKDLVGKLMSAMTSRYDAGCPELELFFRRLTLTNVSYSPLQVCTLTRSLVATILGSITTYLAVIVQM